jgi:DNA-binding NtrC family response regulator
MDLLLKYHYPGNVRELENVIHRAVVLARGSLLTTADLPLHLGELRHEEPNGTGSLVQRLAAYERAMLVKALKDADGVQTRAARALGISERHLRYRLKKHGLSSLGEAAPRSD